MEICFPDTEDGAGEQWDTINSFASPIEALYGCSECVETVKLLKQVPYGAELKGAYVRLRVFDAEDQRMVFWEGEDGGLRWDEVGLEDLPAA